MVTTVNAVSNGTPSTLSPSSQHSLWHPPQLVRVNLIPAPASFKITRSWSMVAMVAMSRSQHSRGQVRIHVVISHPSRDPSWSSIRGTSVVSTSCRVKIVCTVQLLVMVFDPRQHRSCRHVVTRRHNVSRRTLGAVVHSIVVQTSGNGTPSSVGVFASSYPHIGDPSFVSRQSSRNATSVRNVGGQLSSES